jgi:glyoxylase-like metal-dependent hydrolase (beta-lactamase superfamily II)
MNNFVLVHNRDKYYLHPFECGERFNISDGLYVLPTPGHTMDSVSLVVKTSGKLLL